MTKATKPSANPEPAVLERLLLMMCRIRLFEEALYRAFMTERMPGTMHQAIGQEGTEAGVGVALDPSDLVVSSHRGHGHAIIKGVSLRAMMAEMYAKDTGVCRGVGGSLHLYDIEHGFLGTNGIVGAGLPIAAGAGLGLKLDRLPTVVVAFFGDGAMNTGAAHEALNLAAAWKLPVLFICENNQYAVSMPITRSTAIEHLSQRAIAYGMPGETIDGNDAVAVYDAVRAARARAVAGEGPALIECLTYRYKGHSRFEPGAYRSKEELDSWLARDPIELFCRQMEANLWMSRDHIEAVRQQAADEVADAVRFARESADMDPELTRSWVYAS